YTLSLHDALPIFLTEALRDGDFKPRGLRVGRGLSEHDPPRCKDREEPAHEGDSRLERTLQAGVYFGPRQRGRPPSRASAGAAGKHPEEGFEVRVRARVSVDVEVGRPARGAAPAGEAREEIGRA